MKPTTQFVLFLFIFCFWANLTLAQEKVWERLILPNQTDIVFGGKKLYFLEDTEGKLRISDILKADRQAQFERYDQDIFTHKATRSVFWFKINAQNLSGEKAWIAFNTTFLWYIDYYTLQGTDYQLNTQTGTLRPAHSKAIPTQFFWFPIHSDSLVQTVYFRVETFRPVEIPIEIGTSAALYENQRMNDFLVAGFVGLVLVMFVYNFFILLITKDKIYFWYIIYLIAMLFQTTYVNNYPLFSHEKLTEWTNLYIFVWGQQSVTLIIIFTTYFLDFPKIAPKSKYLTFPLIFILSGLIPLLNLTGWVHYTSLSPLIQVLMLVTAFSLLFLALYLWLVKKQRKARFYTFAWTSLLATMVIYFMVIKGILPYNILTRNSTFFGAGIEIVIFAIALADRINQMRSEKNQAQAQTIQLVKEQNIILEKKVSERTAKLNQTNEELNLTVTTVAKQRDDILSSINYALRIQNAIIPKEQELQKSLDCFVFFRPRDIVSGDFYWFAHKENIKILVVADCTGHGVSGAFMTMIGNNILNQIVYDQEIHQPDRILNLISPLLEKTLLHSEGKVKDGMDISIISIENQNLADFENLQGLKINYAGAMNPLYYVENQIFTEIKADKIPIGGGGKVDFLYRKHEIMIKNLMGFENPQSLVLYLCSDGFQDQFGGEHNRKFMVSRFKELLFGVSEKPMAKQKQILEAKFDEWKGAQKQTDDVLVVGIRV